MQAGNGKILFILFKACQKNPKNVVGNGMSHGLHKLIKWSWACRRGELVNTGPPYNKEPKRNTEIETLFVISSCGEFLFVVVYCNLETNK